MDIINKFLNLREIRVEEIEVANNLYIKIGESLFNNKFVFSDNSHIHGCMYQFFAFSQNILFHFIFNNFQAIIGNYDLKKDCLKSWEIFQLGSENIAELKAIRSRYSKIRNSFLAHISTEYKPSEVDGVATKQIKEDVKQIRKILNLMRKSHGIPIEVQGYDANKHPVVVGMQMIFTQLLTGVAIPPI